MRVGSIVECIDDSNIDRNLIVSREIKRGELYTVRALRPSTGGLFLEEIESVWIGNCEIGYKVHRFREVVPPISNVEEHINVNIKELEEA